MGGLDSNAMRVESIYFDLLKEVRKAKIENNNLILLDNFDNELLIFKKN